MSNQGNDIDYETYQRKCQERDKREVERICREFIPHNAFQYIPPLVNALLNYLWQEMEKC